MRSPTVSVLSNATTFVSVDSAYPDAPRALAGESVFDRVQRVAHLVATSQGYRVVSGVLTVSSFRLDFSPYDASSALGSFELPTAAIDRITRERAILLIETKDLRTIRLAMHDASTGTRRFGDSNWIDNLVRRMRPPTVVGAVFAFDHFADRAAGDRPLRTNDGWLVYSPMVEYMRVGLLPTGRVPAEPDTMAWRLVKNSKFRFSPSYPQFLVAPTTMTEDLLVQAARFRSRARLAVAVWRHPQHRCVLARSSQPNFGVAGSRCEPDRVLLKAYRDSAKKNNNGESPPLRIFDARKPVVALGNRIRGKGVEKSQHYDNAVVEMLGIPNIHSVRDSLDSLKGLVNSNSSDNNDSKYRVYLRRVESTGWLKQLILILSGSRRVAEALHDGGASVLVHGSDGWDRTSQIVSLAQLMLDPYYRTFRGFAVLVEKEWCAFGHKFTDRVGVGKDAEDKSNERSPVMLQFLDCVWQLTRQYPTAFEFSEKFLLHILDGLVSGLYGTFLYNTERERTLEKVWTRTESVWTPVLESPGQFRNIRYRSPSHISVLRPNLKRIVLWDTLFFRWDAENDDVRTVSSIGDLYDSGDGDDFVGYAVDEDDVEFIHDLDETEIEALSQR